MVGIAILGLLFPYMYIFYLLNNKKQMPSQKSIKI